MDRRRLLAALATHTTLAGLTPAVRAQTSSPLHRIGVLSSGVASAPATRQGAEMFRETLRAAGYEEGRNLVIEWRYAEGQPDRLPALAEELVRLKVELIVASSNHATSAARRASASIPIVMLVAWQPVEAGFVESLARPGGNTTGTTASSHELSGKQYQLLKEVVPTARRVAVLVDAAFARTLDSAYEKATAAAGAALGLELQQVPVERAEALGAALDRIAASGADALFVAYGPLLRARYQAIADFAVSRRLPAMGAEAAFVTAGGLLYYGPSGRELLERTVAFIVRILRGARPGELPVEMPSQFTLVVNRKTARAMGLVLPNTLLLRADEVVE